MARQNKTKYAALGVLSNHPGSGYDIKKVFERYIGEFWSESYGQIYPTMKSLVEEGFSASTVERTKGKPDRHIFSITEKGMDELRKWLELPTEPHKERLEVLLKLMCGAHMPAEANIKLIERFRDEWMNNLKRYEEINEMLNAEFEGSPHLPFIKMQISCGKHIGNAFIDWCDETLAAIRAIESDLNDDQPAESH